MTTNPLSAPPPLLSGTGQAPTLSRLTPVDTMRVLRQYARALIVTAVLGVILGVGAWALLRLAVPVYQTESQLEVTGAVDDPHFIGDPTESGRAGMEVLRAFMLNQTLRIKSQQVLDDALVLDNIRETNWYKSFGNPVKAREELQDELEVAPIRGATVISAKFRGRPAGDLRIVLDGVINTYLLKIATESRSKDTGLRMTFTREVQQAEELETQLQKKLARFAEEHDLPSLQSLNSEAVIDYSQLSTAVSELGLALQGARENYRGMLQTEQQGLLLTPGPDELAQVEQSPVVAGREEQIRRLREQRDVYADQYGPEHRIMESIDLRIRAIDQEKQKEIERLLRLQQQVRLALARKAVGAYEGQLTLLGPQLDDARLRMRDFSEKIFEFQQIAEDIGAARLRRLEAEKKLAELRVLRDRPDSERVHRIVHAIDPELVFPTIPIMVPAVTILILGVVTGVIFLKEMLDQRIKSPADVKLLPKTELLGVIPDVEEDPSGRRTIEGVVTELPDGLMAEAFRHVRTQILAQMDRRGHKTLMLVGAQAACGVTALTNNLAVSLAQNGRKVLVLDANLRRPSQHELFGVAASPGLTDVLYDTESLKNAIVNREDPNLAILPAGQNHPIMPELFEGQAFRELLPRLESDYDLILVDAPPGLLASDSELLSKTMDAVVVVVRAMGEKRGMVTRMINQLGGHRADVLGVILNRAKTSAGGYFRESYEAFYRYRNDKGDRASVDTAAA